VPRISAASVAEHVARQEAAVVEAAIGLFLEHGYRSVSLADIAEAVGLARNSLYRYFPGKEHILLAWLRREMPDQARRAAAAIDPDAPPVDQVLAWARFQLDYAREPVHQLLAAMGEIAHELDPEARAELADSHRLVLEPVQAMLEAAGVRDAADRQARTSLLFGLVLGAARHEEVGGEEALVRARLEDAVRALVPGSVTRRRR
jgi:AcrR family transcriptional regulator